MKTKRLESIDPNIGVHPQEGFAASDRLQPHIQNMLDGNYPIEIALAALGEGVTP